VIRGFKRSVTMLSGELDQVTTPFAGRFYRYEATWSANASMGGLFRQVVPHWSVRMIPGDALPDTEQPTLDPEAGVVPDDDSGKVQEAPPSWEDQGFGPEQRSLSDALPPSQSSGGSFTLGMRFTLLVSGMVSHLRYWHGNCAGTQPHVLSVWNAAGGRITSVTDIGSESAWREVALPTGLFLTPGVYSVSLTNNGTRYGYFGTGEYPASLAPAITGMVGVYGSGDVWPEVTGLGGCADVVFRELLA
jgi:hypothetical protein